MKRTQPWHHTRFGAVSLWLGSIQFAIPILILVTLAMVWGTYLESVSSGRAARAAVYGSWWFMVLMALICVSLIFAVITRYPWKRKHAGFILVHASLVALIVGGFWSLLGRVEGHIALEQGRSSGTLEMEQERLELVEHDAGQFRTLGEIDAPTRPGRYTIGGFPLEVVDTWENTREEFEIRDDGADPYRAVQIQFGAMPQSAIWIGDEARGEAPVIDGIRIRVLAAGRDWQPPAVQGSSASQPDSPPPGVPGYVFTLGSQSYPLAAPGQPALPGWTVVSVKSYQRAMVAGDGLIDEPGRSENPAVEVTITDGAGTLEKHTAFANFPDMIVVKTLEGTAKSGARLLGSPLGALPVTEETLVIYGDPPAMKIGYVDGADAVQLLEHAGPFPWTVDLGRRRLTILAQFTRAREQSTFVQAPTAKERRPALVIRGAQGEAQPLAWKAMIPFALPGRVAILRYRPQTVALPFSMNLNEFRKTDYPGTQMAMAYESDVTVTMPDASQRRLVISMNKPLEQSGWKVYQSGFVGSNVSIFSVMRDPGLGLTYLASTTLCIGILITFYGRGLSWGHPGVPVPFSRKEQSHVSAAVRPDRVPHPPLDLAGGGLVAGLDPAPGIGADPGRRACDAVGYVRA